MYLGEKPAVPSQLQWIWNAAMRFLRDLSYDALVDVLCANFARNVKASSGPSEGQLEADFSVGTYHAVPGCAQKYSFFDRYSVTQLCLIPTPTPGAD